MLSEQEMVAIRQDAHSRVMAHGDKHPLDPQVLAQADALARWMSVGGDPTAEQENTQ